LALVVHRSNRIDVLARALGDVVAEAPLSPLATEHVVVGGRRVAGWLSMRLAERFGVWSGASFPFPRRFVAQVMKWIEPERSAGLVLDEQGALQWLVLPRLDARMSDPAFADLRRYCKEDPTGLAKFGLAARIAALFDRYLVHRPEMVLGWERGGSSDDWQAMLWRDMTRGNDHFAALLESSVAALRRRAPLPTGHDALPPRVSFFGIASLPPSYLQLVHALSEVIDVHLFVPSPSMGWWAEIRRHRRRAAPEDLAFVGDEGHPLLASLGTLGGDFQRLLETECTYVEPTEDLYREPPAHTMLGCLQADLLHLRVRGEGGEPAWPIADDDESIAVFSCHSRLREVEVLHDRVLAMLAADPTLEPRDIAVYLTDVDGYAPLVEAVFERDRDDPTNVPFSIADRSPRAGNPTLEAWLRILALVGGRMTASEILDLLALEPVAARFGFAADELDRIGRWVDESGIRWGIDAAHRAEHGQPALDENTWRFGLRRLLLGHALPDDDATFAGVLPWGGIEGSSSALLGRLVAACDTFFDLARRLAAPRTIAQWHIDLEHAIAAVLVGRTGAHWEIADIREAIARVAKAAAAAGFVDEVPLPVVRDAIVARLDDAAVVRGSTNVGIGFAALQPMRALPSRVVVVLGLADGTFPHADHGVDFDHMRRTPRPGDRSGRDDDRYAFLETLVAASERVLLGYVGQSSQDDRDLPPSVVLAELLDVLGASFVVSGTESLPAIDRARAVRQRLVTRQPMQPFSPRNFGADPDPRLFSYAAPYLEGARVLTGAARRERAALFTDALPPLDPSMPVDLDRFVRLLQRPQSELLKRRLDVDLKDWSRERTDREPMELENLDEWKLGARLLELRLAGVTPDRCRELLRQAGGLPLGALGEATFAALAAQVEPLVRASVELGRGPAMPPRDVDLRLGDLRLVGHLRHRHEGGLRMVHFGKLSARHEIELWVLHLVAHAIDPGLAQDSAVVARTGDDDIPGVVRFAPVAAPMPTLESLATLYARAMREPVLLFPRASKAYVAELRASGDPEAALAAARTTFRERGGGDASDEAVQRIFGDQDPLAPGYSLFERPMAGGDFAAVAVEVFAPLFEHRRAP
jgi:exodeoxyribonuclease V gamma subunit